MQSKLLKYFLTAYLWFQWIDLVVLIVTGAICAVPTIMLIGLGFADMPSGTPYTLYLLFSLYCILFLGFSIVIFLANPISIIATANLLKNRLLTKVQKIALVIFPLVTLPLSVFLLIVARLIYREVWDILMHL